MSVEIMLDSGSSISLVQKDILAWSNQFQNIQSARPIHLLTASGDQLPIVCHIRTQVKLGELELLHEFVVVESLVTAVILGVDFLQRNRLVLNFSQMPIGVHHAPASTPISHQPPTPETAQVASIYESERTAEARACHLNVHSLS